MTISTRPETRDHVIHRADTTATTSRRILQWALALLMILSVTVSRTARADADDPSDPIARERLSQGNKLYRLREFAKAIDEYKAGVLAEDAPVFAFNLGQCYRQLSTDDAAAIWHFERYLSRGHPTAERRVSIEGFLRDLHEKVELATRTANRPPIEAAGDPHERREASDLVDVSPWYADGVGWIVVGGGLVGAGASGYLLLNANDLDDQANAEDRQDVRNQLRDKASTRRLTGALVGVGGLALIAAGVVKLAIHSGPRREHAAASIGVGFTGNGLLVFGSF